MGYMADMTDSSFKAKTENTGRIIAKIERYGYSVELDDDGNITGVEFVRASLSHSVNEKKVFESIAPYMESGSYIEMSGENGERWRWVFSDGNCKRIKAEFKWTSESV